MCVWGGALRVWGGVGLPGCGWPPGWGDARVGPAAAAPGHGLGGGGGIGPCTLMAGLGPHCMRGLPPPPLIFFPSLSQSCMWRELGYRARACDGIFGLTS